MRQIWFVSWSCMHKKVQQYRVKNRLFRALCSKSAKFFSKLVFYMLDDIWWRPTWSESKMATSTRNIWNKLSEFDKNMHIVLESPNFASRCFYLCLIMVFSLPTFQDDCHFQDGRQWLVVSQPYHVVNLSEYRLWRSTKLETRLFS